jgi:hypothetical protein
MVIEINWLLFAAIYIAAAALTVVLGFAAATTLGRRPARAGRPATQARPAGRHASRRPATHAG